MTRCSNVPPTCSLKNLKVLVTPVANITGSLDMCTREGVTGGTQLPRVLTSTGVCACVFACWV